MDDGSSARAGNGRRKPSLLLILGLPVLVALGVAVFFPFSPTPKDASRRIAGRSHMRQLGTRILIYAGDHDDHFPLAMESARALRPVIIDRVEAPWLFKTTNPRGGEILGDARLGGRLTTSVKDPERAVMLFDSLPWPNGSSPVCRVDGSAKTLPHATIAGLLTPDPFGGLTVAEERQRERAAAP